MPRVMLIAAVVFLVTFGDGVAADVTAPSPSAGQNYVCDYVEGKCYCDGQYDCTKLLNEANSCATPDSGRAAGSDWDGSPISIGANFTDWLTCDELLACSCDIKQQTRTKESFRKINPASAGTELAPATTRPTKKPGKNTVRRDGVPMASKKRAPADAFIGAVARDDYLVLNKNDVQNADSPSQELFENFDNSGGALSNDSAPPAIKDDRIVIDSALAADACIPGENQIAVYQHANYKGKCVVLDVGRYENAAKMGIANDSISSAKLGPDVWAISYQHANFGGRNYRHEKSEQSFPIVMQRGQSLVDGYKHWDEISSLEVGTIKKSATPYPANGIVTPPVSLPPTNGLAAPSDLQISNVGSTTLMLSWRDNATTEFGVELYRLAQNGVRRDKKGSWEFIGLFEERVSSKEKGTGRRSDQDYELEPGTDYCYRLRAYSGFDRSDVSGFSKSICTKTKTLSGGQKPGLVAPSDLQVSNLTSTTLTLSWIDNAKDEYGVELYRMDPVAAKQIRELNWEFIGLFEERVTSNVKGTGRRSDQDYELEPDTNYCYRLRAYSGFDRAVVSDFSRNVCVKTD